MGKILVTESELRKIIAESVESVIAEDANFSLNPFKNFRNQFNDAKSAVRDNMNSLKGVASGAYNAAKTAVNKSGIKNVLKAGENARNLANTQTELSQSRANYEQAQNQIEALKADKTRLYGELEQIAKALGVSYTVTPNAPIQEAAQIQATGVNAILGAIKALQNSRAALAKTNQNLTATNQDLTNKLAMANQRIQNNQNALKTPNAAPISVAQTTGTQTGDLRPNQNQA